MWKLAAVSLIIIIGLFNIVAAVEEDSVKLKFDYLKYYIPQKLIVAEGNVKAEYKEFTITADSLQANLDTNEAIFQDNITLSSPNQTLHGKLLTFNFDTKQWKLQNASSTLQPEFFKGDVLAPLFLKGTNIKGSEQQIDIAQGGFTSCNLLTPHYRLEANEVLIYPGRKLIARGVSFWAGNTKLLSLPSFVLSLKDITRQPFVPRIGQTNIEGRYFKALFNYYLTTNSYGSLHLDLMERKGIGKGLDHNYFIEDGKGLINIYHLIQRDTGTVNLSTRLQHNQTIFGNIQANLLIDYRKNSYYYLPGLTTSNYQLDLSQRATHHTTNFITRFNKTIGWNTTKELTTDFHHTQQISKTVKSSLSSRYYAYQYGLGQPINEELNSELEINKKGNLLDWTLITQIRDDLDKDEYTADAYYPVVDRLPEFILSTDSYRLQSLKLPKIPARMQLSLGNFHEEPAGVKLWRTNLSFDIYGASLQLTKKSKLTLSTNFKQGFYGDNTAQYVIRTNTNLTTKWGKHTTAQLTHFYQEPHGYTPFRLDYASSYHLITAGLTLQKLQKYNFDLRTGFDFETHRYQDLIFKWQYTPSDKFQLSLSSGYSLEHQEARDWTTRLRLKSGESFILELGSRYSPKKDKFLRINTKLDWQIHPKYRLQLLSGYNGFTRKIDYQDIMLTRDLHCWAATLTYSKERKELRLDLSIKALPPRERWFGIGQYGQSFDTSMGEWY